MSEAVLISIRPEWCQLIAHGEKTVEIRKTRPKLKPPFKCYMYCSAAAATDPNQILEIHGHDGKIRKANGHVIGEFVCDNIMKINRIGTADDIITSSCITNDELNSYLDGCNGYAWHISKLKNYEIPRELSVFSKPCHEKLYCESCAMYSENEERCGNEALRLHRAPQSWQYVEELSNG